MDALQETHLDGGYRHIKMADVGSTNYECLLKAKAKDRGKLFITADRQLQGKGSRGRSWVSETGNLYASLLLKDPGELNILHTLSFVTCLAIRDAIYSLNNAGLNKVALKWPNDVLLNGKKTSGILLESHDVEGVRYVIIGMGVNIEHFPAGTTHAATSLNHEGLSTTREYFFHQLVKGLQIRMDQWNRGSGFDKIRNDWLAAAARLNEAIEVNLPANPQTENLKGTFRGIDENGLLLLEQADGKVKSISVADIFFA